MKMAQLQQFGISPWFIDRWAKTIGPELLDWQADTIRHFDLFGRTPHPGGPATPGAGRNLIVIAPTSSGKTFLAELAMADALMRRHKVVYVAPLKALTVQKYDHFREVFTPLGFRVVISTRDQRGADDRLRRGDFDIAVTVYEKLQHLLLTHLDLLTTMGLVICDEPQLLFDPQRGPTVAHIFDTLAMAPGAPRALLLAAPAFDGPQAGALAAYLGAAVQRVHRRPVELRVGVLNNGQFHFREHNSTEIGDEAFPWDNNLPEAERPMALLNALAEHGERVLVFCPSKAECHRRACALAEQRPATDESKTRTAGLTDDDRWRLQSGPSLAPALGDWLSRGVAVHHADLTLHQRALVESLFAARRVSVVFCTGTLAWGVNLPATTVFIDAEKYTSGPHAGRLIPIPLERLEFEGMAGRAGRLQAKNGGADGFFPDATATDPIGRGVLWSHTPCEAELLWQTYVAPATDHPPGSLSGDATFRVPPAFAPQQRLLNWVAAGLVHSPMEAHTLAARSPFGRSTMTDATAPTVWDDAAARLASAGMIQMVDDIDRRLVSTPRGSKTAAAGLSIGSAIAVVRVLEACGDFDAAIWITFLSSLPEAAEARLWRSGFAGRARNPAAQITTLWHERFSEGLPESIARRFASDPNAITVHFPTAAAQGRAMLTALVLDDWASGVPTRDLEQRYGLPVGRLEPVADTIAWLFETTASLAETTPSGQRFAADCHRAGFEIGHGVPVSRRALAEALGGLVPRQTLLDLIDRGWDDPLMVSQRRRADLAGLAPPGVIEAILRRCRAYVEWENHRTATPAGPDSQPRNTGLRQTDSTRSEGRGGTSHHAETLAAQPNQKEDVMSPILHLSGVPRSYGARMPVELAGRPLTLRLKSFKYLFALAAARLLTRDGWIAKAEIETGDNQIKYLYQLRHELAQAGISNAAGLIENDGGGHYRLALPPQAIRLDLSQLLQHPDWDIRSRAERLAAAGAAAA